MKNIFLTFLAALLWLSNFSQQTIRFNIQHKLGSQNFAFNQVASNNLGNTFKLDRLQYYLSGFEIIHDGGQTKPITNVYYLADASLITSIDLGSHTDINSIEGIKFAVGVNTPENNADPSQWPATHALSPKSPSMHWGWASGYFFVALGGNSGPITDQPLEMHALGNANYFSQTIATSATLINNERVITLTADYARALLNINLSNGLVLHGSNGSNVTMLTNFRDSVFSALSTQTIAVGLQEQKPESNELGIYPNPSAGMFVLDIKGAHTANNAIVISDITGRILQTFPAKSTTAEIKIESQGLYFVSLMTGQKVVTTKKVIVR